MLGYVARLVRVYDVGGSHAVLTLEAQRRVQDGWSVADRSKSHITFRHTVLPPWWWHAAIGSVFCVAVPLTVLLGPLVMPETWPDNERFLRVTYRGRGTVSRRSSGRIPTGWKRARKKVERGG